MIHPRHLFSSCSKPYSSDNEEKTFCNRPGWVSIKSPQGWKNKSKILSLCPEPWRFKKTSNQEYTVLGYHAIYSSNGYMAELGFNETDATRVINVLKTNWIDHQTRVVFLEFAVYNPGAKQIVVVAYVHEFTGTGGFSLYKNVHVLQLHNTTSVFYLICQVVLILFTIYYFVIECTELFHQRFLYFTIKWNWLEICQLVSIAVMMVYHTKRKFSIKELAQELRSNPYGRIGFQEQVLCSEQETVAASITIFFTTLKLLKMNRINPYVIIFFDTCSKMWKNFLPTFLVSFTIIMLSFAQFGNLAFGSNSWAYSTVPIAICSQFLMLISKAMPLYDLEHADPIFARLFAFAFLVVCNVNLMNMFIAMMMDSHGEAAGVDRNSERFGVSTFMTERLSEWIYGDKQAIGKKNEEQDTRKKSAKPNDSFNENSATEEYQRVATSSSIGRRISRGQELRPENPKDLEPLSAIPFAMVSSVTSLQKNVVTQQMLNVDNVEATVSTQPNPPVLSHTVRLKQKQQSVKTQRAPNFDNHETKVAAALSCVPAMVGRALGVEHIEPIAHAPPSADLHEPVG